MEQFVYTIPSEYVILIVLDLEKCFAGTDAEMSLTKMHSHPTKAFPSPVQTTHHSRVPSQIQQENV